MRPWLRHRAIQWSILGFACVWAGCQKQAVPTAESPDSASADSTSADASGSKAPAHDSAVEKQREKALAAKQELFQQLSGRLMEVMSEHGPAAAITVCSEEAPQITSEVGKKYGVAIGRTSFRLRNPKNKPPAWASSLIQQRVAEPQLVNLANGQLGALLPIRLQPQCLLCHGPEENIPAEVKQALAQGYPDDQATGFAVDQLRGWFWIEVPPAATEDSGNS